MKELKKIKLESGESVSESQREIKSPYNLRQSPKQKKLDESCVACNPKSPSACGTPLAKPNSQGKNFIDNLRYDHVDTIGVVASTPTKQRIKEGYSSALIYTPSKLLFHEGEPSKATTTTPRARILEKVACISFREQDQSSPVILFQPMRPKKLFYEKSQSDKQSPDNAKKIPFQLQLEKSLEQVVSIQDLEIHARKNLKKIFGNNSAFDVAASVLSDPGTTRYEFSHLLAHSQGAWKIEATNDQQSIAAIVTVTSAEHNSMRRAVVEKPANKVIAELAPLTYSVKATLLKDQFGQPTHLGGDSEVSQWSLDKHTSIEIELDPQNPQIPSHELAKLMDQLFYDFFQKALVEKTAVASMPPVSTLLSQSSLFSQQPPHADPDEPTFINKQTRSMN